MLAIAGTISGNPLEAVPKITWLSGTGSYPPNSRSHENQSVTLPIAAAITNQTTPVNNVNIASTRFPTTQVASTRSSRLFEFIGTGHILAVALLQTSAGMVNSPQWLGRGAST